MEITGTPGLPLGYSYWYEADNDREFTIKIKEICEETLALEWVKQLSLCSFTIWRVDKTYRQGYEVLFKKHFRCHHALSVSSKKCNALMNIRIMRNRAVGLWPCIVHFRGKHNHEVGVPFSIVYHPITEEIKNEILDLYRKGYHQYNAYTAYCKKNISDLGLDSWAFFADKYIFPTKEDFKELWMKYVRDAYIAKMSKKCKENVNLSTIVSEAATNYEDSHTIEVQDLDEEYFGKRMIDETNSRLDANIGKPFESFKIVSSKSSKTANDNLDLHNEGNATSKEDGINVEADYTHSLNENCTENKDEKDIFCINTEIVQPIEDVLQKIRPQLKNMTKERLIALCIHKIVEEISAKCAFRQLYKMMESQGMNIRSEICNKKELYCKDINVICCGLCESTSQ